MIELFAAVIFGDAHRHDDNFRNFTFSFFTFGDFAFGVLTFSGFAFNSFTFGGFAFSGLSLGGFAFSGLTLGGFAFSSLAFGGFAFSSLTLGGFAFSGLALGGFAFSSLTLGGFAFSGLALGGFAFSSLTFGSFFSGGFFLVGFSFGYFFFFDGVLIGNLFRSSILGSGFLCGIFLCCCRSGALRRVFFSGVIFSGQIVGFGFRGGLNFGILIRLRILRVGLFSFGGRFRGIINFCYSLCNTLFPGNLAFVRFDFGLFFSGLILNVFAVFNCCIFCILRQDF